jgi:hypothetical protein
MCKIKTKRGLGKAVERPTEAFSHMYCLSAVIVELSKTIPAVDQKRRQRILRALPVKLSSEEERESNPHHVLNMVTLVHPALSLL